MQRCALVLLLAFSSSALAQQPDPRAEAQAALAQTSGTLKLAGLTQPVEVLRDKWGVAHIFAKNQHDLFFAQGFVAAQDRLFQMELWKRVGQGRLAEAIGPAFLERDVNARLLQFRGDMQAEYASYGPDTREILQAFTDGINAFIASARHAGKLPVEFKYAGFAPEPWKPEDCLTRMAGFPMTGNARAELYDAELVAALGPDKAARLLDLSPKIPLDPAPGVDYSGLKESFLRNLVGSDTRIELQTSSNVAASGEMRAPCPVADAQCAQRDPAASGGSPGRFSEIADHFLDAESTGHWPPATEHAFPEESNDWTISGRLTASGKPILANDPHRAITVPSLRYIVHLVAPASGGKPAWDVIGAGEPGLPGVAIGHNQRIAWGLTIFPIDQQDLYIEELNPANPLEYKTEQGWEKMRVEQQEFRVKGSAPVTRELKFTRHGPVLWSDGKRALALRWVGAEPGTAGYLASLSVDRAQNWNQYLAAMQRWKVPPENLVYADVDGNIGEQSAGLAPIRNWPGLLPVPGGEGKYEWKGFVPLAQLPRQFNPRAGFYATANNKVIDDDYLFRIGYQWAAPYRVDRIKEVLGEAARSGHKFTLNDMSALQTDVTSLAAKQLLATLRQAADDNPKAIVPEAKMLLEFDGTIVRDSPAAALYEAWVRALRWYVMEKLLGDQTGHTGLPLAQSLAPRLSMTMMIDMFQHPAADVFGPNPVEARNSLLLTALGDARIALAQLTSRTGERTLSADPSRWSWGKLHAITFRHPLDSALPFADLGPVPRPGDGTTVNATGCPSTGRFGQTAGASYREIFDLSNWDASLAVNTPGQSGQPLSPHYADLLPLWDAGQYFPLAYSREAVEKVTTDRLILQP